jgi:hypothetical protein
MVLAAHATAVWALCGATMGIGMKVASLRAALVAHAIAAPVITATVMLVYFSRFGGVTPLASASFVVGFIVLLDFFVVALLINRSLDMFRSALGTWIPFALIIAAAWVTGMVVKSR